MSVGRTGFVSRIAAAALLLAMLSSSRGQWTSGGVPKRVRSAPLPEGIKQTARTAPKSKPLGGGDSPLQLAPTSATDATPQTGGTTDHFDRLDSNQDGLLDRDEFKKVDPLVGKQGLEVRPRHWHCTSSRCSPLGNTHSKK